MKNAVATKSSSCFPKVREKKITHLYFNDKYLKRIPRLMNIPDLLVLYLHNNEIYQISDLQNAKNLSSLYLQKNRILKMENLENLKKLKKLYLGHNSISVVEGLQNIEKLEELHIEKQFLQEGNSLCFDPRSIYAISLTLQVLNISHNKIQTISSLAPIKFLRVLNASHNELSDMKEVCQVIKDWFYLKDLSLNSNPICKSRLYKEDIIANVYCLQTLDHKDISDHTRNFLKRLHEERLAQRLHKTINFADKVPEILMGGQHSDYLLTGLIVDLSKNYSSAIQKAVSINILKQNKELNGNYEEIFDEKNAVYIPWKTLPKPQNVSKLRLNKNQKKSRDQKTTVIDTSLSHLKI